MAGYHGFVKFGRTKLLKPSFNASELSPVKVMLQRIDHRFDVARDPTQLANRLIAGFFAVRRALELF